MPLAIIAAANSQPPVIDQRIGDTTLHFSADRAWALLPGDCVNISWAVEGIESLHVEGRGEIGYGEKAFCPNINDKAARFAVRTPDGLYREYDLRIEYLPDLLLYLAGFVGAIGSLGLIAYLLTANRMDRALNPRWVAICLAALVLLGTTLRLNEPEPPRLEADDGQVKVAMWAEHASIAFPQEPIEIEFSVVGAQTVRYRGEEVALDEGVADLLRRDENGDAFALEAVGADGLARQYTLPMPSLFRAFGKAPVYFYWSLLVLLLAALLYLPMALRKAHAKWLRRDWADLVALAGLAALVLAHYLPFGFDGVARWEEWDQWQYIEATGHAFSEEYPQRFMHLLPTALGWLLQSESFGGLRLTQFAILVAQVWLAYGIGRKLDLRALHSFLLAALFHLYPVNDLLLSLPIVAQNSSVMWLLLSVFCALDWLGEPGDRRALCGAALAALLNVGAYEAGLALVATAPILLWLRFRKSGWRLVNLALLFVATASFKVAWFALLYSTKRPTYGEYHLFGEYRRVANTPLDILVTTTPTVYLRALVTSWQEAIATLADNQLMIVTLPGLAVVCAAAAILARSGRGAYPAPRATATWLAGGLAAIFMAVGVMMWLPLYRAGDMARLFFYVPIGGAVVVFCLALFVARPLAPRWRDLALVALCMALFLPALSRMLAQHDDYRRSARARATALHAVLEALPRPLPGAKLALVTDMSLSDLVDRRIHELSQGSMFSSAMRTLYEEDAPSISWFCMLPASCSEDAYGTEWTEHPQRFVDIIALELKHDLTVALVEDPSARFGWNMDSDYDATSLFDADAPLPPRAKTMLASRDS